MGTTFDMPRWKIALLFGGAALIGGAYGAGVFDRTPKGELNAKIDWKGVAEPRFAKLDDAEKAWMDRSAALDSPPVPVTTPTKKPADEKPAPAVAGPSPAPAAEPAPSDDGTGAPGVPE
jgi:hypothetical protein